MSKIMLKVILRRLQPIAEELLSEEYAGLEEELVEALMKNLQLKNNSRKIH